MFKYNGFFYHAGHIGTTFAQRSRMVENLRKLFSLPQQKHSEQHGGKIKSFTQHDVHMVWNIIFFTMVGKVRVKKNFFLYGSPFPPSPLPVWVSLCAEGGVVNKRIRYIAYLTYERCDVITWKTFEFFRAIYYFSFTRTDINQSIDRSIDRWIASIELNRNADFIAF